MKKEKIPDGWERIKLEEILKEVNERNKNGKVKNVLSVTNSQGFVSQEEYFEGTVHSENISNYKIVRKNQFAYNPSRVNVGSIGILKKYDEGALSPMYVVFEVNENRLLPDYFKYYFETYRFLENVKNNTQGSVRNSLNFNALASFEYLLPSIEKQEKIVKILENVELIIDKYEKLLKNKNQFIKSKFTELLKKEERYIQYKKLDELVVFQNGINAPAEKYGTGIKYISVMDILNNSYIDYKSIRGCVEIDEKQKENYNVSYGDILFVRSSENLKDAGKSNVYLDKENDAVFGGFVIRGKKKVEYNPNYINIALRSDYVRKQIMTYAAGTQHINIGQENLKKVLVPICLIDVQNDFEKIIKLIEKQKFELEKLIKNYKNLKKGLIQKLLTGKVNVYV